MIHMVDITPTQHLPWTSSDEYNWIHDRIMNWLTEEELPITKLGWEFIVQKYNVGFEFKPHIDDVLSPDKKTIKRAKDIIPILIQLSETSEYGGGELWVNDSEDIKVNQEIGNVSIFDVKTSLGNPITSDERWSCTIF